MPIHLTTGLPGSGKTLNTLVRVKELAERENREVYYHGINDLQLSWKQLDDPKQWNSLPEGSIIVIDECQDLYPVHETKLAAEPHVLQLAKHRHRGYDIFLISQHPMNIHAFVRRLIDQHWHIIRAFGMQASNIHSWNRVIDYPEKVKKDSQTQLFNYPKDAYKYYKSAEVHTIQRKIPARLKWLIIIPFLLAALGWKAWSVLNPKHYKEQISGKAQSEQIDKTNQQQPNGGTTQNPRDNKSELTYIQAHTPELQDFAYTAPVYKDVIKPVTAPYPAACLQSKSQGCKCFTQQGTQLQTSVEVCQQIVKQGFFIEWQQNTEQARQELKDSPIGVSGRSPDVDRPPMHIIDAPLRASPGNA